MDTKAFADKVHQVAAKHPEGSNARFGTKADHTGGHKVFIDAIRKDPTFGHMSKGEFDSHLLEASKTGHVILARQDITHSDPKSSGRIMGVASEIQHPMGRATFHFVDTDPSLSRKSPISALAPTQTKKGEGQGAAPSESKSPTKLWAEKNQSGKAEAKPAAAPSALGMHNLSESQKALLAKPTGSLTVHEHAERAQLKDALKKGSDARAASAKASGGGGDDRKRDDHGRFA